MKEFKLEIDTNTIYIKVLRFIGALGLGFMIGATMIKYQAGIEFEWPPVIYGIPIFLFFAFFPGLGGWGTKSLHINDEGLFLYPLNSKSPNGHDFWGSIDKIAWDRIKTVVLNKSHICIFPKKGSSKKINLPLYTKEQWNELKEYLREAAEFKGVKFST